MTSTTDNRTTELLPCPICRKKVYIGLYGDGRDYWWMVHGGMHYDECKCRLFMESCKFELEDEAKVDYDERAMGIRGGLVRRWNTRAELGSGTCEKDQLEAALALSRGMVDMAARREIYKDNRIADLEQLVRDMYDVAARGEFDVGEESKFSERMAKLGVVDKC